MKVKKKTTEERNERYTGLRKNKIKVKMQIKTTKKKENIQRVTKNKQNEANNKEN